MKHVPDDKDVEFKRIVRNIVREFGRILVSTVVASDQCWGVCVRYVDGDSEIHEVVFDPSKGTGGVDRKPGTVGCISPIYRMESFGVHRIGIHHNVWPYAIPVCGLIRRKGYGNDSYR